MRFVDVGAVLPRVVAMVAAAAAAAETIDVMVDVG